LRAQQSNDIAPEKQMTNTLDLSRNIVIRPSTDAECAGDARDLWSIISSAASKTLAILSPSR